MNIFTTFSDKKFNLILIVVAILLLAPFATSDAAVGSVYQARAPGTNLISNNSLATEQTLTYDTEVTTSADITRQSGNQAFRIQNSGRYLIIANTRWNYADIGNNNRHVVRTLIKVGGSELGSVYGEASGYGRDSGNATEDGVVTMAYVDHTVAGGSADDITIHVQNFGDTSVALADQFADQSGIQIIRLPDDSDYLQVHRTTDIDYTGTLDYSTGDPTWNEFGWETQDIETDTAVIEWGSGNDITLKEQGHYLVIYSIEGNSPSTRGAAMFRLKLDDVEVPASRVVKYMRQTDGSTEGWVQWGGIIETDSTNEVLNIDWGSATESANTADMLEAAMTVVRMPDTASYVRARHDANRAGETTGVFPLDAEDEDDEGVHSIASNTGRINGTSDNYDWLLFGSWYLRNTSADSTRTSEHFRWYRNGSEVNFGSGLSYTRGDQSTTGVPAGGRTAAIVATDLGASDYMELNMRLESGTGSQSRDFIANRVGVTGVALDTLVPSSSTISISGSANGNDGETVMVAINNTAQVQTATIGSSAFSITGVTEPSADDIITVWVDSVADANEATGITKWSSGDITGMVLNDNVLSIGSDQNTSLSLTEIDSYSCADNEDVMHSVISSTLAVEGNSCVSSNTYSGESLSILSSNTMTVGTSETVESETLSNAGTLTLTGSPTIDLSGTSGTLFTNTGTFTAGTSTVELSGDGSATINSGSPTLYNLTSSGAGTKSLGAGITLASNGTLTVSDGTFDPAGFLVTGSGTNTLSVGSGATLDVDASTFAGNYSAGFTTTTFDSASTTDYSLAGAQDIAGDAYGILWATGSGTKTLAGNTTAASVSATADLELSTYDFTVSGAFLTSAALSDNSATGTNTFSGPTATFATGSWSSSGNADFIFEDNFTHDGSGGFSSGSGTYTFQTNASTLSGANAFTIQNLQNDIASSTGLTIADSDVTVSNLTQGSNAILTFSGAMPTIEVLDTRASGNLVQYTGSSQTAIGPTTSQTHSLDLEADSEEYANISDGSQTGLDITGDLTASGWVRFEDFNGNPQTPFNKYRSNSGDRSWSIWVDTNTTTLPTLQVYISDDGNDGTTDGFEYSFQEGSWYHLAFTYDASGGAVEFFVNGISLGTKTGYPNSIVNGAADFNIGRHWSASAPRHWDGLVKTVRVFNDIRTYDEIAYDASNLGSISDANLQGEWLLNNSYTDTSGNGNTLTAQASPEFITTLPQPLQPYHDLTINVSGTTTLGSITDINNDLTISGGTLATGNYDMSIAGNYSNSGTFTPGTGTVTFDASDTGNTLSGTLNFNNLTFNNANGAWSLGSNATDVDGDFTVTDGAVTAPSSTLTVGGDFTNTPGTASSFVHNSGTVIVDDNSQTSNITGDTTFNNLSVTTDNKEVRFGAGETFTVNGLLTLLASGHADRIMIQSTSEQNDQWYIDHQGTENVNYIDLDNSGCDPSSTEITVGTGSKDGSNNDSDCWAFSYVPRSGGTVGDLEGSATPDAPQSGGGQEDSGGDTEGGGDPDAGQGGGGQGDDGGDLGFGFFNFAIVESFESVFSAFPVFDMYLF